MSLFRTLQTIISTPSSHARFLFHLSSLEKSGYDKLLKFKNAHDISDTSFLEHLTDEARHAGHLRRLAHKLGHQENKLTLPTKNYLTKLEVFILRELRRAKITNIRTCYLVLTYIIEKRAEILYPTYEKLLSEKQMGLSVASIISDEDQHLQLMIEEIKEEKIPLRLLEITQAFETKLFDNFMMQFR